MNNLFFWLDAKQFNIQKHRTQSDREPCKRKVVIGILLQPKGQCSDRAIEGASDRRFTSSILHHDL